MSARLLVGDAAAVLGTLEAGSAQLCVTSPPYYSLRQYSGADTVFGGDPSHAHEWGAEQPGKRSRWGDLSTLSEKQASNGGSEQMVAALEAPAGRFCACGAWKGQLGLEPTPDLYLDHLVAIFAEVRRVLHPTGVLAVNMGSSYASQPIESDEWELRDDLTDEERAYVFAELAKVR